MLTAILAGTAFAVAAGGASGSGRLFAGLIFSSMPAGGLFFSGLLCGEICRNRLLFGGLFFSRLLFGGRRSVLFALRHPIIELIIITGIL